MADPVTDLSHQSFTLHPQLRIMDRRSTLEVLFTGRNSTRQRTAIQKTAGGGGTLAPYTGPWNATTAAHLLRRTTFGPTQGELDQAVQNGLSWTLNELFKKEPLPTPPINYYFNDDPYVPIGSTWIDAPYSASANLKTHRNNSLFAWTVGIMLGNGLRLREKMTLFWHNHFVTSRIDVNDPKYTYIYISLLRENALGNFRELTKQITVDPSMLRYLNGNQSTAAKPNENYAREVMELFTIGKGPQVGPGDYTNYTEDDVLALARVFTGWRERGYNTQTPGVPVESYYTDSRHDKTTKQLSHRFNNAVITNGGDQEYKTAIDIIFQQDECARYICRKLYRWFVYYEIDADVEANVIEPMAQTLIQHDYDISWPLFALLQSEHFYDDCIRGAMIKHPIDFVMTMLRQGGWFPGDDLNTKYRWWRLVYTNFDLLQMPYYAPPSVAGWKAWYQEPTYYQGWLNSVTLPNRANVAKTMTGRGIKLGNLYAPLPLLDWVASLDDPYDPIALIDELAAQLFPRNISDKKKEYLLEVLLPGLPEYEWTVEYGDYLANPNDEDLEKAVVNKLSNLISTMMQMPEYQLS